MEKTRRIRNLFTIVAIPLFGYAILNVVFLLDALYQTLCNQLFLERQEGIASWILMTKHVSFAIFVLLISWIILRAKKINDVWKSVYATVPTAVILFTIGIILYRWPIALYMIGALMYGGGILYLWKTKRSWMFLYSITLVTAVLWIMGIMTIGI